MATDDVPRPRRLLNTKLFVPRARAGCVLRPRLHARLAAGTQGPLTLVSAAAGWGKTTLVADWLHRTGTKAAWLSLDHHDADPARLLAYLLAALRNVNPELAPGLDLLGPEPPDPQVAMTEIVNDMAEWGHDAILVLDDLHHVEAPAAHELLAFMIEAAPPNLHVVITTRVDPPMPLPRFRARGQLVEIRAPQLRFSVDEVRAFFEDAMGLPLPTGVLEKLETRTEGWAAGLQMAALSLRGRDDVEAFIDNFAGSHRFVLDYLMEEVLAKMTAARRDALLRLSILRELSASVVDALLGGHQGQALLESLEAENLFLVALDDTRSTYRFHHLFGTLLGHELSGVLDAAERDVLHVRAAEALEQGEALDEAFHHAIEGHDFDRAERLLLVDADAMILRRAHDWMLSRTDRFGAEELAKRPAVLVKRVWLSNVAQQESAVHRAVAAARAALKRSPDPALSAELTLFEAIEAQHRDKFGVSGPLFDIAERDLPRDNPMMRSMLIMHRAFDDVADDRFDDALAQARRLESEASQIGDEFALMWAQWFGAQLALLRGEPRKTIQIMESMIPRLHETFGERPPRAAGMGFVTLAMAYHARGELDPAIEWVERALDVLDPRIDPGYASSLVLSQAAVGVARDPAGPGWREAIEHGHQLVVQADMPVFSARLRAHTVRHCLDARTPDDAVPVARAWLAEPGIRERTHRVYAGVPYPTSRMDFVVLVLARSLTVLDELDEAERVAREFLARANKARRQLCIVEGHLSLAAVAVARSDPETMQAAVALAVQAAAPERLVSPFFGHDDALVGAALACARTGGHTSLAGYLAARLGTPAPAAPARRVVVGVGQSQDETLSGRELEVLSLVAEGMSNAEIGRSLYVAPSTVKKHLEHVYDKLGVRRRTQAVARARTLSLL